MRSEKVTGIILIRMRRMAMRIRIYSPTGIVADEDAVKLSAEGIRGAFTILPRHIDYGVPLKPGILIYYPEDGSERIFAIDEGLLVKRGGDVLISSFKVIKGDNLESLEKDLSEKILEMSEKEKKTRSAVAMLEGSILKQIKGHGERINL
ncbi:MAG: F0F1 ATP synthase subunit epsilon [candidate division Zixibacteria bacterium]|nr:F0F1 ATP synthase subunit epsilon [candidate division Zixibacteria bacterium]